MADFPAPVGITASTSRPASTAAAAVSWPGRKVPNPRAALATCWTGPQCNMDGGGERRQRSSQALGQASGVGHEGLHLRFAELRTTGTDEPAPEPFGAGDAHRGAVDRYDGRIALQHRDADVLQGGRH